MVAFGTDTPRNLPIHPASSLDLASAPPRPGLRAALARAVALLRGLIRRLVGASATPPLAAAPGPQAPRAAPDETLAASPPPPAPPALDRLAWTDRLWGAGHLLPGGDTEALRLAALLPLSPQTTLLLVGAGAGGAAAAIAGARGTFVAAHDASLAGRQRATPALRKLARRVSLDSWNPGAPEFRAAYHHHALLLEPLRGGGTPEGLLAGLRPALRPGAQVVLLEVVLRQPGAPGLERWCGLEERALPPAESAVAEALRQSGCEIHVTEDAGARQVQAVLEGWTQLVASLDAQGRGPAPGHAAALVAEAEAWLLRLRLLREGSIALLRWHATLRR